MFSLEKKMPHLLSARLAASPAGLYLSPEEREFIVENVTSDHDPVRAACRLAGRACVLAVGDRSRVMREWNDGSARALDFPLLAEDVPNDRVAEASSFLRVDGKRVF